MQKSQEQPIERYDKAVQTPSLPQFEESRRDQKSAEKSVPPPPSDDRKEPQAVAKNSITAIKKRMRSVVDGIVGITVMSNQDGLQQIHMNLEDKAICSSVGIVERALTQVDEYDFMVLLLFRRSL